MQNYWHHLMKNEYTSRLSGAVCYGFLVAIAMNYFWQPGHIYSSGFTGLAQLLATMTHNRIPIAAAMAIVNVPVLVVAWLKLSRRFAVFTTIAVLLAALLVPVFHTQQVLTHDAVINAMFGGAINGAAVGFALRYGVGTGGLDIVGTFVQRRFGVKIGLVNLAFNAVLMICAGLTYGWQYALYSIVGIVISSRIIDALFTRQQHIQLMIITTQPDAMVTAIHDHLRRGVTIVDGARGGYTGNEKAILLTVITASERFDLQEVVLATDPGAFSSSWKIDHTAGHFYQPAL